MIEKDFRKCFALLEKVYGRMNKKGELIIDKIYEWKATETDKEKAIKRWVQIYNRIEKEIKDWQKVAESKETPKLPGEGFEKGWRLTINRVCNSIENILNGKEGD